MPRLATAADPKSDAFARNAEVNLALAAELRRRVAEALDRERHCQGEPV